MDNADVIHELDRLIDSYNWHGLEDEDKPHTTPQHMHRLIRTMDADALHELRWRISDLPNKPYRMSLVITHVLLDLLGHPCLRHKQWVLDLLSHIPLNNDLPHPDSLHRLLHPEMPLLRRFLNRREGTYCILAARVLAKLVYKSDEIAHWLLERLRRERSPHLICHLLRSLTRLITSRLSMTITPETWQALLNCGQTLLKARMPLIRIAAVTLLMQIQQHKTPVPVFEALFDSWPRVSGEAHESGTSQTGWIMIGELLHRLPRLGDTQAFAIILRLLREAKTYRVAGFVLETTQLYRLTDQQRCTDKRVIALTSQQTSVLEALLACRPFWQCQEYRWQQVGRFDYYGLEVSRRTLRQQIQHIHIVDQYEMLPEYDALPLFWDGTRIQVQAL